MTDHKTKDETGKQYGQWTVLRKTESPRRSGGGYWLCRCSCGREVAVYGGNLRSGQSTGCGCQAVRKAKKTALAHGKEPFMLNNFGVNSAPAIRKQVQTLRAKHVKVSLAPVRWPEERD